LLQKALHECEALGQIKFQGFTPPTWHANPYLFRQVRAAGFTAYSARFWEWDQARGKHLSIPFSFAGVPGWFAALTRIAARVFEWLPERLSGCFPAGRLVLHPGEKLLNSTI
jgi:hypothetical protein